MSLSLHELKRRRLVWSAEESRQRHASESGAISSGFSIFDQKLGGWPCSGLVELQLPAYGIGELRLVLPVLANLSEQPKQQGKLQVWITDQFILMPQGLGPAFQSGTVVLQKLEPKERLWVLDTLLQSGVCSAVVCWLADLTPSQAKRLQVSAKESGTLVFCLRSLSGAQSSLPVSLRIRLEPCEQGLVIDAFKRQNAFCIEPFMLSFNHAYPVLYDRSGISEAHAYQHNVVKFPSTSVIR